MIFCSVCHSLGQHHIISMHIFFLDKQEVKLRSSIIVLYDSNDMLSHDLIIKKMRKGIVS